MPRKQIAYDELPIIPAMIAESVCQRPYTGAEWSWTIRDASTVERIEAARQRMTLEQVRAFSDACERLCHAAYDAGAKWFCELARARDNSGRDQLYVWASHWLASYLDGGRFAQDVDAGI